MRVNILTLILSITLFANFGRTEDSQELTADDIVKKANHMSLYQGQDSKGKVSMKITDKQGRTRKREFNMLRKDSKIEDKDQKYFVYFLTPSDVRKMTFMVHKHTDLGKEDDRWLYLPGLDLVKRIASGDKRTSFVGSDFLYEDISGRNVNEDVHQLAETNEKCYVIKNIPKEADKVEFSYYIAHIDKNTFLPTKIEYYKKNNKLYRVIENTEIKFVESEEGGQAVVYPTVVRAEAKDMESGSKTVMTFSKIQYNISLKDELFTERYLRRPPRKVIR